MDFLNSKFKPTDVKELNERLEEMIYGVEVLEEFKYEQKWEKIKFAMGKLFNQKFIDQYEVCWDKLFSG